METEYYQGLCGVEITVSWEGGMMYVTCERGYGMQCQGEKSALAVCDTCRFCFEKLIEEDSSR